MATYLARILMGNYELEIKKLNTMISDLEAKLTLGFDPAFHEMLERFKVLREKYQRLLDTGSHPRSSGANTPYWSNVQPDRQ